MFSKKTFILNSIPIHIIQAVVCSVLSNPASRLMKDYVHYIRGLKQSLVAVKTLFYIDYCELGSHTRSVYPTQYASRMETARVKP